MLENLKNSETLLNIKKNLKENEEKTTEMLFNKILNALDSVDNLAIHKENIIYIKKEKIKLYKTEKNEINIVLLDETKSNPFTKEQNQILLEKYKKIKKEDFWYDVRKWIVNNISFFNKKEVKNLKKDISFFEKIKLNFKNLFAEKKIIKKEINNHNEIISVKKEETNNKIVKNFKTNKYAKPKKQEVEVIKNLLDNKKIKDKTILCWDIENIALARYKEVLNLLEYIPSKIYIVSTFELNNINKEIANLYNMIHITGHNDSDERIREIIRDNEFETREFTIVSSDADFVPISKTLINKSKLVTFIMDNANMKRILMTLNLDDKRLKFKAF